MEDKACKWGGCNGTVPAKGGACNRCGDITHVSQKTIKCCEHCPQPHPKDSHMAPCPRCLTPEEQALVDLYTD